MVRPGLALLSAVFLLAPDAVAHAQADDGTEARSRYEQAMGAAAAQATVAERLAVDRRPSTVSLSVGMLGFMGRGLSPKAPMGPGVALRYGYHPSHMIVGWELGMVTATSAPDAEIEATVVILETGVKISGAQQRGWSPLVAVGVGYGMFAGPTRSDHGSLVVPLAAGIEGGTEDALFGLRAVWRPSVVGEAQVIPSSEGHDTWQIVADVGVRF